MCIIKDKQSRPQRIKGDNQVVTPQTAEVHQGAQLFKADSTSGL